jgi:hypothetical protein
MIDGNTLLSDVGSKFGAPMGRMTVKENTAATVTLFRMRMVDDCYDAGGAYWGAGKESETMYAAIGDGFQTFVRAGSLDAAKAAILEQFPDLKIQMTEVNDDFVNGYMTAALWITNDDEDTPLDSNFCIDDIDADTKAEMIEDCRKFLEKCGHLIVEENCTGNSDCSVMAYAGHDFWLTRNGHGCGFWDGDWADSVEEVLTEAAKEFGEVYLYPGDDGKIYS